MQRVLELHFFRAEGSFQLVETRFNWGDGTTSCCIRGKTAGAFRGAGTFQWTSAVRAVATLFLRSVLSETVQGLSWYITGGKNSAAASLDYAISKGPCWLSDMFGLCPSGQPIARRLFLITNSNRKRPGPVSIAVNKAALSSSQVVVFLDGLCCDDVDTLLEILRDIDTDLQEEGLRRCYGSYKLAS